MPSGTGISATWGIGKESTVGTAVAPARWFEFTSEGFGLTRTAIQGQGIRGGGAYGNRAKRRVVTAVDVSGSIAGQLPTRGLGLLVQSMLGSDPVTTQIGGTAAWQQIHKMGDLDGKSFTVQKRVPDATGANNTFSYRGCKATGWTVACAAGEIATLSIDYDGWNEDTTQAYTPAVYFADAGVFSFRDGAILTGGTVAESGGVITHTGGTAVASITGVEVRGSNTLKTDRRFFGNNGVKAEQLENGIRSVSGTLDAEYTGNSLYNSYVADSQMTLRLTFTSPLLADTGQPCLFEILLPAIFLSGDTPKVAGTDVVPMRIPFDVFEDTLNMTQIKIVSKDTAP